MPGTRTDVDTLKCRVPPARGAEPKGTEGRRHGDGRDRSTVGFDPGAGSSLKADGFPDWLDGNRYRRESKIGHGGMGRVYRYRDPRLDRLVAVKAMPMEWSAVRDARRRLHKEARLLASLDHANIARIHHLTEHDGRDYLILEYVAGRTLEQLLEDGQLTLDRVLRIMLQVGRAIEAGHAVDVVHLDVKPGNIMVTSGDVVKLLDYGIASYVPENVAVASPQPGESDSAEHRAVGTAGYMSPEQAGGRAVDRRADTWAFGCVLFECLMGRPLFPGDSRRERMEASLRASIGFDALPPDVPPAVHRLLRDCLCRAPAKRLADIGMACSVLQRTLSVSPRQQRTRPVPNNLSNPLTRYVPRAGEDDRLDELLRHHRLVTLIGPGGCGKTRLAGAVAQRAVRTGDTTPDPSWDGVWLIELAGLRGGEMVQRAVETAVLSRRDDLIDAPGTDALGDELGDQAVLLILDNCEHLIGPCATFVDGLLRRCPNVRVLATSRERLLIAGEQTYQVPPLSFPPPGETHRLERFESVRLFLARAALSRPEFSLDQRTTGPVAEICRRLEGIPLAIELAAARIGFVPVEDITRRLLDLLTDQPVLESSIASSVETLDTAQRTLLGRLSVFRGGWTLEAAEAICGDGDRKVVRRRPVLDLLGDLVNRSLALYAVQTNRARYHMLETVREYCRHHLLRTRDAGSIALRHGTYYESLASEGNAALTGPDQGAWLDRLEAEHDNLRAALVTFTAGRDEAERVARMTRDLRVFWSIRGHLDEGRRWLEHVIDARRGTRDMLQVQVLNAAGAIAERQNDLAAARGHYESALRMARGLGDRRDAARALTNLGVLEEEEGHLAAGRHDHEASIVIYRSLHDDLGIATAQLNLGILAKTEMHMREAGELIESALVLLRRCGSKHHIAASLHHLGELSMIRGGTAEALEQLRQSLALSRELGDRRGTGETLLLIGAVCATSGRWQDSARLMGAAEHLLRSLPARMTPSCRQRYEEARSILRDGLDKATETQVWTEGALMTSDEATDYALMIDG